MKYKWILLVFICQFSHGLDYTESSVGFAVHEVKFDDVSVNTAGYFLNVSAGKRFPKTLSAGLTLKFWGTDEKYEHNVYGLSLGVEAKMFLPAMDHGPYVKGGRHCWAVSVIGALDLWDGSGCSNTIAAGFQMPAEGGEAKGTGMFYEVMVARFRRMHSSMFVVGTRF